MQILWTAAGFHRQMRPLRGGGAVDAGPGALDH
mgnify:CR=1 FL=1